MKYSELIIRKKEYKYSANISFDLKNEERLSGFIPNVTTTEILSEYLYGIIEGTNIHSRILYGSYGTGKSHLLTVLCALLGYVNINSEGFKTFVLAIRKYDEELANYIKKFSEKNKPYLVVPVYSDYHDFDKCITFSLKRELDRCGIDVCFKSYYQEAYELLKNWKTGKESSARLDDTLKRVKTQYDELKNGLENFDRAYEQVFNEVFKIMTFGATFVSDSGNLMDNLDVANAAIKENYQGIVFVFDEFGRYIEDEGESIKVKSIQDLAEYCDHSEYNDYVILVSHKQLSLYTDKMKKSLSEEWRKIEGRFKVTSINVKYDQCLSLIPHIIPKTVVWDSFKGKYEEKLRGLYAQAYDFKGFLLPPEGGNPFEGGFPIHPITLYALDRLSKRVAQNERTFFTYLASDEKNALFSQLEEMDTCEFHFVGLDKIYDYFEVNIRSYKSDEVYAIYKKLQFSLNKLGNQGENAIEIKILKTIAVINIIADTTVLSADKNTLGYVIDADAEAISRAIDNLERLKIVKYMRQYGFFDFLDSSIYDFDSMIENKMESISDEMVINELNSEFINFVVYPHEYNCEYHMNRIFVPVFTLKKDILKKSFLRMLPSYYDGILTLVFDNDYSGEEYRDVDALPERSIILVNSKTEELLRETKRYIATKYFYSLRNDLKKDDPTVEKELTLYLEEQKSIVFELVRLWRTFKMKGVFSWINGTLSEITSDQELSKESSLIMEQAYPDTLIVNNDLVNKNNLSGTIRSSRNKVLTSIMEQDNIFDGFTPMSPEHTMLRSVLLKNGLCDHSENDVINILPQGDNVNQLAGEPVRKEICRFLKNCEKAQRTLGELYCKLKEPPYGLRDGYIPILLAYELRNYENVGLYFHGTERDYGTDELLKAMDKPEDYSLYLCNWTIEQRKYIDEIEKLFEKYLRPNTKNRLKELYVAMNLHYSAVPKIARATDRYVSSATKKYRQIMSITHKDYYKFFFSDLLALDDNLESLVQVIKTSKQELENVLAAQILSVEKIIKDIIIIKDNQRIATAISEKYNKEWIDKEQKSFDYQTNALIEYAKTINSMNQDDKCANDIAKIITGFEMDYWSDSTINDFESGLKAVLEVLSDYRPSEKLGENELQIIVKNGEDESVVSRFDKCEISTNGQVMLNKMQSTLENFGQGISHEEKLVIIAKILSELR